MRTVIFIGNDDRTGYFIGSIIKGCIDLVIGFVLLIAHIGFAGGGPADGAAGCIKVGGKQGMRIVL